MCIYKVAQSDICLGGGFDHFGLRITNNKLRNGFLVSILRTGFIYRFNYFGSDLLISEHKVLSADCILNVK